MSRYKKVVLNTVEFEIDGNNVVLRPSKEKMFKALQVFKESMRPENKEGLQEIREYLNDLLWTSLTDEEKKEEMSANPECREDIDTFIIQNLHTLWMRVLEEFGYVKPEDKKRIEEKMQKMTEGKN